MRSMRKNNLPPVIIITPTYNQANFIQQTIESVLTQNYSNLHYWIMDGKSTDSTAKIVEAYSNKLHFLSQKDNGQTDAINKGIKLAIKSLSDDEIENGIFAYINSDDYYLPGSLKKVAEEFAAHPQRMWLVGDAVIVDEHNNHIQQGVRWYKKAWRSVFSGLLLSILNPIPQPAVFIRLKAVKKLGEFKTDLHYTMDYEYWLRLYHQFGAPLILAATLSAFRIHAGAKGSTGFTQQFSEEYQVAKSYTRNSLALLLHSLHNQLILLIYTIIK
jgi:glycosyltransferase involved in cell wall biosynthesis